jgi:hypothetical protein
MICFMSDLDRGFHTFWNWGGYRNTFYPRWYQAKIPAKSVIIAFSREDLSLEPSSPVTLVGRWAELIKRWGCSNVALPSQIAKSPSYFFFLNVCTAGNREQLGLTIFYFEAILYFFGPARKLYLPLTVVSSNMRPLVLQSKIWSPASGWQYCLVLVAWEALFVKGMEWR